VIAWNADGQDWADSLPALLEHACARWDLTVGEPYEGGYAAWIAPAERADGTPCVVKLPYPDDESEHEADALLLWAGDGAVRLLEREEMTRALLLERLAPGTSLLALDDPEEALTVACGLLPRLWRPLVHGHPFVSAGACAARWAVDIERAYHEHGGPFDIALLRAAVAAFEQLAAYDGESVLLHQDFHRGNVLRAGREPWLAIDPKPYIGDPAYDVTQHIFNGVFIEGADAEALASRMARLLDLDLNRILLWLFARAVEASPYWGGMADLAQTLYPLLT
jgi:streptomycin 6-kinase